MFCLFCFNDTATTVIYTYEHAHSLHDARPICRVTAPAARAVTIASPCGDALTVACATISAPSPPGLIDSVEMPRSEEHTYELQSLMRNSYDVFCLTNNRNAALHNTPPRVP